MEGSRCTHGMETNATGTSRSNLVGFYFASLRCRTASNRVTRVAMATFSESAWPGHGDATFGVARVQPKVGEPELLASHHHGDQAR